VKKTLIITLEYPPQIGGIATYAHQFSLSLERDDVIVLAPPIKGDTEFDSQQPINIFRRTFYYKFFWPRWLKLYVVIKKIVKTYEVDVIHLHHILPVGYVARMIKRKFGIPYLIFSHGTDIAYAAQKGKRKKTMLVAKGADQILVNSENLKERLLKEFPELAEKTAVLYPCPDQAFLTGPAEEIITSLRHQYALEGKQVLLSVSRLDDGKGFPHLIRLLPSILEHIPHLVWFIVGDGPKKDVILQDIQKHNLQNVVRFIGEIPHADLRKYYHLADVFVLLTHPDNGKEEGLGLVFLEAAAAGLPVVAGRSGGVAEAVLHEKTGLVINLKQDPEGIVDGIVKMLKQPAYAQTLGEAGQERIKKQFIWKEQLKAIDRWL